MGKAIQDARVKVGGQAGPMGQGQGVPLTQAVGQGGLQGAMDGKPLGPNSQVPGAKGLWDRAKSTGRMAPGMGVPNTGGGYAQSKQDWLQQGKQKGGFFKQIADRKQQLQQQRAGQPGFFQQVADRKQQLGGAPGQQPVGMGVPNTGGGYAQSKQDYLQNKT